MSTGVREWVTLGKFECLRGVDFVLGDVCKRKPWREWEERVSETWVTVSFSVSVSKIEKRGRRVEEAEVRHACFTKRRCFGDHFPPKIPTRHRFGDHFRAPPPQKSNMTPFYINKFPTKFPTLDRLILSLFFGFLFVHNFNINKWVESFKTNSPFTYIKNY